MKKLVSIFLFSISIVAQACVNPSTNVYELFNDLLTQLPPQYSTVKLNIVPGSGAYALNDSVNVGSDYIVPGTGNIRAGLNTALAFVIGHELGHIVLGHVSNNNGYKDYKLSKQQEWDSDAFGLQIYLKSEYCSPETAINEEFKVMQQFYDKASASRRAWGYDTHGTPYYRKERLLNQLNYLETLKKLSTGLLLKQEDSLDRVESTK